MYQRYVKRILDFILSLAATIVLAIPMGIIALWIKADSPGPVFFKQRRVGKGKTHFNILKFRTMRGDTPHDVPTHLLKNADSYITKSGAFLRKTSLDELPQIYNILAGQMSIIGPRPALYNQYDLIDARDKVHANDIRPGLTGLAQINGRTDELSAQERRLKRAGGTAQAVTGGIILLLDAGMLALAASLAQCGTIGFDGALIAVVALMSSFGPVIALANLGTGLQNTFAAGNRVLDVLDEQPTVREVTDGEDIAFTGAACRRVTFGYGSDVILDDVSLDVPQNAVIGITGRSGSGKSTLLKLMMRFWDTDLGKVELSGVNIKAINTASLRDAESFVEQDTVLFHDSIEENLRIANRNATHEQVAEACKKASIHDFIMTLPQGYDTPVGELGSTLSGGERQRLGVARAFLHDAPYILLDEPTSNLDSLNEAVILKSLAEERRDKTIVLVSHRASTMRIADRTYSVENGRMS